MSKSPINNLPTEVLRTLVTVSDVGSLSKAAPLLGLSQPALSSQLKRMQRLLGDPLFNRTANGSIPTELGALVIELARRMLDTNDRILQLSGVSGERDQIRVGLSSLFIDEFASTKIDYLAKAKCAVVSDTCTLITKAFSELRIDVALVLDVKDHRTKMDGTIAKEFEIEFAWMRSPNFVLRPGLPIPLAIWPPDQFALHALAATGRQYRIMFSSPDYFAKFSAVKSGQCVAAVPRNAITSPFMETTEFGLPKLGLKKVLLGVHGDPKSARFRPVIDAMSSLNLNA
jgi:DNA-binding transcriptional LysR family regulator